VAECSRDNENSIPRDLEKYLTELGGLRPRFKGSFRHFLLPPFLREALGYSLNKRHYLLTKSSFKKKNFLRSFVTRAGPPKIAIYSLKGEIWLLAFAFAPAYAAPSIEIVQDTNSPRQMAYQPSKGRADRSAS
jgi:hypothetical protein